MASYWHLIPALCTIAFVVAVVAPTDVPGTVLTVDARTIPTATPGTVPTVNGSYLCHPAAGCNATVPTGAPKNHEHYVWLFSVICLLYFFCTLLLFITLLAYTCCMDENNHYCAHVKHYVASLLLSIVLNVVQEIMATMNIHFCSVFCLLRLFMIIATCWWQIIIPIDIYFYISYYTDENTFKKKTANLNVYFHIGCWGTSAFFTFIRYNWFPTTYHENTCLNSGSIMFYFPISGLVIIILNVILQICMTIRYNVMSKNVSYQGVNTQELKEKLMSRNRMIVLMVLLWFVDVLCWLANKYQLCESDLHITSYIDLLKQAKIVQGCSCFYIYMFDSKI